MRQRLVQITTRPMVPLPKLLQSIFTTKEAKDEHTLNLSSLAIRPCGLRQCSV